MLVFEGCTEVLTIWRFAAGCSLGKPVMILEVNSVNQIIRQVYLLRGFNPSRKDNFLGLNDQGTGDTSNGAM